ncbi:RNA polymerase sigma-70 factor [Sphingobacterium corticibacter]|uniref:RNA polymerase sigma-70 factor n=1 Tax=Sphingobacterium corticibacter TaxID=2171749 RepID=A0A2T8HNR4_9SPHI|nr:RNA polymerase sigma-70 factor [Sphingobacterium corticibacter]PVH27050.1 RNA polymerase sigma-70 factor [Sphingobacterium corticibacter]
MENHLHTQLLQITTDSFKQLFERYWKRLFAFAIKMTADEEDAKEIVQEIFKSLWERRDNLNIQDVERYLLRSVKLKTMEYMRNKSTKQRHHDIILSTTKIDYEDQQVQVKELSHKVNNLVESLPKQCKNVFKMSREEGMTNKEIAHLLLISERAVEYHISKALSALKIGLYPVE